MGSTDEAGNSCSGSCPRPGSPPPLPLPRPCHRGGSSTHPSSGRCRRSNHEIMNRKSQGLASCTPALWKESRPSTSSSSVHASAYSRRLLGSRICRTRMVVVRLSALTHSAYPQTSTESSNPGRPGVKRAHTNISTSILQSRPRDTAQTSV